jgi:hypothetical protein
MAVGQVPRTPHQEFQPTEGAIPALAGGDGSEQVLTSSLRALVTAGAPFFALTPPAAAVDAIPLTWKR